MSFYPLYDEIINFFTKEFFDPIDKILLKDLDKQTTYTATKDTDIKQNKDGYTHTKFQSPVHYTPKTKEIKSEASKEFTMHFTVSEQEAGEIIHKISPTKANLNFSYDSENHRLTITFKDKPAINKAAFSRGDEPFNTTYHKFTNSKATDKKEKDYKNAVSALKGNTPEPEKASTPPSVKPNPKPAQSKKYDENFLRILYELLLKLPNALPNLEILWNSIMDSVNWEQAITEFFTHHKDLVQNFLDEINEELKKYI